MVIGVNANGASISPDPRVARDYSQPVQFTLTAPDGTKVVYTVTVKGTECLQTPTPTPAPTPTPTPTPAPAPAPAPVDTMPTGATIADRWFTDNIGANAMYELNTSGNPLITTFPVPTNSVTNPNYLTNPNCSYQNDNIPINCNGPAYSYWAIDASAVDSASRPLTYSMTITSLSGNALIPDMSANLHINAAGKISQTCPELPNSTACHDDAYGDAEYLITVSALPLGGNLPLVRTFKIKVRDDG
jgi:hypothetical protein